MTKSLGKAGNDTFLQIQPKADIEEEHDHQRHQREQTLYSR